MIEMTSNEKEYRLVISFFMIFCAIVASVVVAFWDIKKTQSAQRTTISSWANNHHMTMGTCLDVKGYCECQVRNSHLELIVRVTDQDTSRIFSVTQVMPINGAVDFNER